MSGLVTSHAFERGGVLDLQLTAGKGNVLSTAVIGVIAEALEADDEPGRRLVLLRGSGGHFSFGASVEEHQRDQAAAMLASFHDLIRRVARHPVPVAALVEGKCLGGALELVLACDFALVMPSASLACPEIHLGVFPPVLSVLGPARIGGALTERLALTGEALDAEQALACGLASAVLGGDPLEAALQWYRDHLGGRSAYSLRQAKRAAQIGSGLDALLDERLERVEAWYLESLLSSHDGNEGIEAFLERRAPQWEHR